MQQNNTRKGISIMIGATIIFACQDAISRHLAGEYNTYMVVMIRYWFFGLFVLALARIKYGGIKKVARSKQLPLQIFRGVLLTVEICVMVQAFVFLGLIDSLAVFASVPLIVAALSGPLLGETVGWRRWVAIFIGFVGLLIILQPGMGVFSIYALIPLCSAILFAGYTLLTRFVARDDDASTSFFWTGVAGMFSATLIGFSFWEPMNSVDWFWMGCLCVTGALGHFMLIKCYEAAEASSVQPFAYLHFVFATIVAMFVFGEALTMPTAIGAAVVISAGLFTWWRERLSA